MYQLTPTATLAADYDWIDYRDPAFDRTGMTAGMDEDAFSKALEEALQGHQGQLIHSWLRPNEKPTRWKLRHLSDSAMRYLSDQQQSKGGDFISIQVLRDAASLALVGVADLTGADGRPLEIGQTRHPICGLPCVAEKTMDLICTLDGGGVVTRMGLQAMKARHPQGNS